MDSCSVLPCDILCHVIMATKRKETHIKRQTDASTMLLDFLDSRIMNYMYLLSLYIFQSMVLSYKNREWGKTNTICLLWDLKAWDQALKFLFSSSIFHPKKKKIPIHTMKSLVKFPFPKHLLTLFNSHQGLYMSTSFTVTFYWLLDFL